MTSIVVTKKNLYVDSRGTAAINGKSFTNDNVVKFISRNSENEGIWGDPDLLAYTNSGDCDWADFINKYSDSFTVKNLADFFLNMPTFPITAPMSSTLLFIYTNHIVYVNIDHNGFSARVIKPEEYPVICGSGYGWFCTYLEPVQPAKRTEKLYNAAFIKTIKEDKGSSGDKYTRINLETGKVENIIVTPKMQAKAVKIINKKIKII